MFCACTLAMALSFAGERQIIDADANGKQPQLAVGSDGAIYVAYGVDAEIRFAKSVDGGRSFSKPVAVARVSKLALGMRRGPRIAVNDGSLVITAIVRDENKEAEARKTDHSLKHYQSVTGDVVAWRSTDGGATWSKGVHLNSVRDAAREGLHAFAAGPDGAMTCVWLDLRDDNRMALYAARSADGGATWTEDTLAHRSPETQICTCCHPSIAFGPDGAEWLMWRDDIGGARDMYLAKRGPSGDRGPARKLGLRTWILDRCPMDGGAIAVDARGAIVTTWMRAEQVYLTDERGDEHLVGAGVQPWAANGPDGVHAVWLARRPGKLFYLAPGAEPRTLADAANDPVIATALPGRSPVVAAWELVGSERGIAVQVLSAGE